MGILQGFLFSVCFGLLQLEVSCTDDPAVSDGSPHWLSWGGWKSAGIDQICYFERDRNCSSYVNNVSQCVGSDKDTRTFFQACSDLTQEQIDLVLVPRWLGWGEWKEAGGTNVCVVERFRNCSTYNMDDCNGIDTKGETDGHTYALPCPEIPHWSQWGSWDCRTGKDDACISFRERTCDSTTKETCHTDTYYEFSQCSTAKCKDTFWEPWSGWDCIRNHTTHTCFMRRERNCSTGDVDDCYGGRVHDVQLCNTTICPDPFWHEWSDWHCDYDSAKLPCFMDRQRNCSTGIENDCNGLNSELKTCDNVTCMEPFWQDWGGWQCHYGLDTCFMKRLKNCSTGVEGHCSGIGSEVKMCDNVTCIVPVWEDWTTWECDYTNKTCSMQRRRKCTTGDDNNCKGEDFESTICDNKTCVENYWNAWTEWKCNYTNNICAMTHERNCSTGDNSNCDGDSFETARCDNVSCIDIYWQEWSDWKCEYSRKNCFMDRFRNCSTWKDSDCETPHSSHTQLLLCDNVNCMEAVWKDWTAWECDYTNTTCSMQRRRKCATGDDKNCDGDNFESTSCDNKTCVANYWQNWGPWKCSYQNYTCAMWRWRSCSTGRDNECPGQDFVKAEKCDNVSCIENYWHAWTDWKCDYTNYTCAITHERNCSTGNNRDCDGVNFESKRCENLTCIENYWQPWTDWKCDYSNYTCSITRDRICSTGNNDDCAGASVESKRCDNVTCMENYWLEWKDWTCSYNKDDVCSMWRWRNCSTGHERHCKGLDFEAANCDNISCTEHFWQEWSNWDCEYFPGGTCAMKRVRNCSTGDYNDCHGTPAAIEKCDNATCFDIFWREWGDWQCQYTHKTCFMARFRNCSTGNDSQCFEHATERLHSSLLLCDNINCIGAHYNPWSEWSCSYKNGTCNQSRNRTCSTGNVGHCEGPDTEVEPCTMTCSAPWTDWGPWHCVYIGTNCFEKRDRNCTTGNNADCDGAPYEVHQCDSLSTCLTTANPTTTTSTTTTTAPTTTTTTTQKPTTTTTTTQKPTTTTATTTPTATTTTTQKPTTTTATTTPTATTTTTQKPTTTTTTTHKLSTSATTSTIPTTTSTTTLTPTTTTTTTQKHTATAMTLKPSTINTTKTTTLKPTTTTTTTLKPTKTTTTTQKTTTTATTTQKSTTTTTLKPTTTTTVTTPATTTTSTQKPKTTTTTTQKPTSTTTTLKPTTTTTTQKPTPTTTTMTTTTTQKPTITTTTTSKPTTATTTTTTAKPTTTQPNPTTTVTTTAKLTTTTSTTPKPTITTTLATKPANSTTSAITYSSASQTMTHAVQSTAAATTQSPSTTITTTTKPQTTTTTTTQKPITTSTITTTPKPTTTIDTTPKPVTTTTIASSPKTTIKTTPKPTTSSTTMQPTTTTTTTTPKPTTTTTTTIQPTTPTTTTQKLTTTTIQPKTTTTTTQKLTTTTIPTTMKPTETTTTTPKPTTTTTTTTPKPTTTTATTTTAMKHTTPVRDTRPRQCEVCSGPIQICEQLHRTETCHYPDNLCMNHIINQDSGARTVERKCSNRQVCYREWYLGSSDNDRCQTFDETNIYTLGFECHYCCTEDGCNIPVHPAKKTLM